MRAEHDEHLSWLVSTMHSWGIMMDVALELRQDVPWCSQCCAKWNRPAHHHVRLRLCCPPGSFWPENELRVFFVRDRVPRAFQGKGAKVRTHACQEQEGLCLRCKSVALHVAHRCSLLPACANQGLRVDPQRTLGRCDDDDGVLVKPEIKGIRRFWPADVGLQVGKNSTPVDLLENNVTKHGEVANSGVSEIRSLRWWALCHASARQCG